MSQRNLTAKSVLPPEVARALTEIAADTGRVVGVLADRRGGVTDVMIGDASRVYLPDVGRLRAGPGSLRALHLVVAKPTGDAAGKRAPLPVDHDLITDLERLKLDCVLLVEALDDGLPGRAALATLSPDPTFTPDGGESRHVVEHFRQIHDVTADFTAMVEGLEDELLRKATRAREAAPIAGERDVAVLVGVYTSSRTEASASMAELKELARTAGVRIADVVVQHRKELDPRTIVGKGKLEEICLLALHRGAEVIIFDRDLSPSQLNAITDMTDLKILDRTMLILDIFARRAQSQGGKMQVELAQLRYSLPRLAKKQTGLSRLTGGIGGTGPGETKLEIDRRRAKDKIGRLEKDIVRFSKERQLRRARRNERDVPVIAIVGYTNAGKSTLMNALTGSDVYAANELFATLDPTSRRLRFPQEREVVLIDTVGFIRDLPASLIDAFRATLEELHDADLLLHVVDGSDPRRLKHVEAVEQVLADLGLSGTPRLVVLNKSDATTLDGDDAEAARLDAVRVSALERRGLDVLVNRIADALWREDALPQRETWAAAAG